MTLTGGVIPPTKLSDTFASNLVEVKFILSNFLI